MLSYMQYGYILALPSPIRQQNDGINKINQLTESNSPKSSFHSFYKFHPGNHISFLIHTLGTLLKHVSDKNKTLAIILNLGS